MKPKSAPPKDVEAYLATVPPEARRMLKQLRKTIMAAAPKAVEGISYGVPGYKYNGRPLVYFGAAKKHCGFYVENGSFNEAYKEELKAYDTSKGTIRFPLDKPLPIALVKKIVKARMAENEAREQTKEKR